MEENAELSLSEELSQQIDAAEEPVTIESVVDEPIVESSGRDEKGRFAKTAEKAETEVVTEPSVQPVAQEENADDQPDAKAMVTPPATWSATAKAIFSTLPDVARKEIAKREQDYARGIQQHAEKARGFESMMDEIRPYEAMIRAENGTPQGAIRELFKTAYLLRTGTPQDRGQLIMHLAQQFNCDLTPYQNQNQNNQGDVIPQVTQLVNQLVSPALQKIQTWEQQQLNQKQKEQLQIENDVSSQVDAFRSATNEDGSPKHLYFDNVRGIMSAYFANGQAKTLDQAYDMACWANPEVRNALIAERQREADAQRLVEAQRKTRDASSASFSVTGQGGVGIAGANQSSLRDELSSQLDAAMGGGRI